MFDLEDESPTPAFFRRKPRGKCGGNADEKWLPVSAKSTKMGRQAAGSETTVEDT